jgi:hypothetical protein
VAVLVVGIVVKEGKVGMLVSLEAKLLRRRLLLE